MKSSLIRMKVDFPRVSLKILFIVTINRSPTEYDHLFLIYSLLFTFRIYIPKQILKLIDFYEMIEFISET